MNNGNILMYRLCFCLLAAMWWLLGGGTLFAQQLAGRQSVKSYTLLFRIGSAELDTAYAANGAVAGGMLAELGRLLSADNVAVDSVVITSSSSPDGSWQDNRRLSVKRGESVYGYLKDGAPALPEETLVLVPRGEDWTAFRRVVAGDGQLPCRQEILDIADADLPADEKERRIKRLEQAYAYLVARHLPKLRAVTVAVHVTVREAVLTSPAPVCPPAAAVVAAASDDLEAARDRHYLPTPWYIKSNLLYDVLLMPSLEVEYRFNERWSAAIEGNMAWWHNNGKHRYYQLATIVPEVRWWFRPQGPRKGHYLGLFGGLGWYDLENGGLGYRGEGGMLGLSYGYMFPVGKYFAFEAGVGLGYAHLKYAEYLPLDGHYVYQQTDRTHYFGPLKLKFAFVWNIGRCTEKGGRK